MKGANEVLNKIFYSPTRVKVIRFFISNPEGFFSLQEAAGRTKIKENTLRKELFLLASMAFVKSQKKNGINKWFLNHSFLFLRPLRNLILTASPVSRSDLLEKFKRFGRLKLVVLSGCFIQEENDSKTDILIVGDGFKKGLVSNSLKNIEAEMGKEIVYVLMPTKEFLYRFDIRDKFIREILESPHQKILDKLKIF